MYHRQTLLHVRKEESKKMFIAVVGVTTKPMEATKSSSAREQINSGIFLHTLKQHIAVKNQCTEIINININSNI